MIAMGKRVRAEILRGSSSIRSFSELKAFEETVFAEVGAQEQQAIYTEMRARNSAKIAQGGFTCDPVLAAESDARRCLAAYVVASAANWIAAPRLERFLHDLPRLFARHVVYQPCGAAGSAARAPLGGRLHWTFLQLVGFGMYEQTKVPGDYLELFETLLWECLSPFEICFDSLILTPSNLVLVGHPTVDVNYVRESVRECMREVGYPVLEPYKSDTLHMTLVRFAGPVTASEQASLEKLVESCEVDPDFNGLLRVNGIAVSPASWKMLASEIPPESVAHIPFPAS